MITVEEAENIIKQHKLPATAISLPLDQCNGRTLLEDLFADRDLPPYNRVTMDGIAIAYNSFSQGNSTMPIAGIAPAGSPQLTLTKQDACLEVMTGAILPAGTDTVIRYEDLEIIDNKATIKVEKIAQGQNIHYQGEDRLKGELIVKKGTIITSAEIGIGAAIGKSEIKVSKLPKVMVVSTGDELVDIDQIPEAHQIRRSNIYRLKSTLHQLGIQPDTAHLRDDKKEVQDRLNQFVNDYDVIILSGGVSKGKFDFLPAALEYVGVQKLFHKIKQRPGKPFWFGKHPEGCVVFALPGNPVSSFMCMQRYFLPWLDHSLGNETRQIPYAVLSHPIDFKPDLVYFAQVKTNYGKDGKISATPVEGHGSGDLANLVEADGFLELPRGKNEFKTGEAYPLHAFRQEK